MEPAIDLAARRAAARMLLVVGVVGAALYSVLGTWSAGRVLGGVDADGGWIDAAGSSTSVAPLEVQVTGHPALWVLGLLATVLIGGHAWASRSADRTTVRRRYRITMLTAAALVLEAVTVCTGLQMWLVDQALDAGSTHPALIGDADVVVSRVRAG